MIQNIPAEKILEVVSQGPTVPTKIVKIVGGDTMLIGAILSTIITTGKIKVSTLKIGGSPLYYIPDHESKLEEYIDHLNEKDRRTFLVIKDRKVLMDLSQDALTRVSLKAIRDFAKPFYLESKNSASKVLFWRFYSVPIEQAELMGQKLLDNSSNNTSENILQPKPIIREQIAIKEEIIEEKPINVSITASVSEIKLSNAQSEIVSNTISNSEVPKELSKDTHVSHTDKIHEDKSHLDKEHSVHKASRGEQVPHKEHRVQEHKQEHHEIKHREVKPKKEKTPKDPNKKDFYILIQEFILSNNLDLLSKEKIKKSEYTLILKNHATNEYIYCRAKDKTTIAEADLAPALIFAQNKKMPCLFLSTGDLSEKTQAMMNNEFSAITFKKM